MILIVIGNEKTAIQQPCLTMVSDMETISLRGKYTMLSEPEIRAQ
jgi:hypothetical protein